VIAYRLGDRAFFLFGFAKNEKDNISAADKQALADYGALLLGLDACGLQSAIECEELTEIHYAGEA
jgi:hypothetical protein